MQSWRIIRKDQDSYQYLNLASLGSVEINEEVTMSGGSVIITFYGIDGSVIMTTRVDKPLAEVTRQIECLLGINGASTIF
jgi:hypothetical protein